MTESLRLEELSVALGGRQIIPSFSMSLEKGQIACLLGASGCGKTTLLRTIAGFEKPGQGEIWLESNKVSDASMHVPVEQRRVGMVFQDNALFPHLSVRDNIAFGLGNLGREEIDQRVTETAAMLEVSDILDSYPHRISGGQQQRVALARAIATRPRILLLDEPFASLDIDLREQIAREVRTVLKQNQITAILVSHNQLEAFAMADVIGVMREGRLMQWDDAFSLYHRPACAYVADFIGDGVFIAATTAGDSAAETELGVINGQEAHGYQQGEDVAVLIRPDDIIHDDDSSLQATVLDKRFRGAEFLYTLGLESGARVLSLVPSHHDHGIGEAIGIRLEIDHLVVFSRQAVAEIGKELIEV